ncbi:hypothetical protein JCM8097_008667 [Rhodosporidiobolus ruineniae]
MLSASRFLFRRTAMSSALAAATKPALEADLVYFGGRTTDGKQPYTLTFPSPGPELPTTNAVTETRRLPIRDLRSLLDTEAGKAISTETTGFDVPPRAISGTKMKYEDWADEQKILDVYLPEVEEMLKKHTGASRVIFFDHTVRRGEKKGEETPDTPDNRKPSSSSLLHVDQTPASGEKRVRRHGGDDAERLLRGRAQLINVWRPFHTVYDTPLAVADARTLSPSEDLTPSRLVYPSKGPYAQPEGETLQVGFSDRHQWYYLSEMQPDEALLLKCWENLPDGKIGTITPHTAFEDPRYFGKDGVRLRESIEVRALVFHEPQE